MQSDEVLVLGFKKHLMDQVVQRFIKHYKLNPTEAKELATYYLIGWNFIPGFRRPNLEIVSLNFELSNSLDYRKELLTKSAVRVANWIVGAEKKTVPGYQRKESTEPTAMRFVEWPNREEERSEHERYLEWVEAAYEALKKNTSEREMQAAILRYIKGLILEDIASKLGVSVSTIWHDLKHFNNKARQTVAPFRKTAV